MTSFAFILGTVPLAIALGAGAGARQALGTAVVFGMLFATLVGVFFIPVFYVMLQRVSERQWPFRREEAGTPAAARGAGWSCGCRRGCARVACALMLEQGINMDNSSSNGQSMGNRTLALLLCRVRCPRARSGRTTGAPMSRFPSLAARRCGGR